MVMRVKDKVAIITGGAHGMGEAEARLFAAEGGKVVVVSFHIGAEGASAQHVTRKDEVFLHDNRGNVYALAHAAIDAGADLVLGHGPHVLRALELEAAAGARIIPRTSGLSDALFEHDGQITKREIRAMTLSSLAPRRHELLWDVGAGTGSVAIEWLLADPAMRALAIESRADHAARIRRNAAAFGVPGLEIVEGAAPEALAGLAQPDAIFVGGGAGRPGLLDAVVASLRSGGRLVVNAVTLETEALLMARHAAHGGELVRIALSRADPVGGMTGWRPAMPVTQWVWTKP